MYCVIFVYAQTYCYKQEVSMPLWLGKGCCYDLFYINMVYICSTLLIVFCYSGGLNRV